MYGGGLHPSSLQAMQQQMMMVGLPAYMATPAYQQQMQQQQGQQAGQGQLQQQQQQQGGQGGQGQGQGQDDDNSRIPRVMSSPDTSQTNSMAAAHALHVLRSANMVNMASGQQQQQQQGQLQEGQGSNSSRSRSSPTASCGGGEGNNPFSVQRQPSSSSSSYPNSPVSAALQPPPAGNAISQAGGELPPGMVIRTPNSWPGEPGVGSTAAAAAAKASTAAATATATQPPAQLSGDKGLQPTPAQVEDVVAASTQTPVAHREPALTEPAGGVGAPAPLPLLGPSLFLPVDPDLAVAAGGSGCSSKTAGFENAPAASPHSQPNPAEHGAGPAPAAATAAAAEVGDQPPCAGVRGLDALVGQQAGRGQGLGATSSLSNGHGQVASGRSSSSDLQQYGSAPGRLSSSVPDSAVAALSSGAAAAAASPSSSLLLQQQRQRSHQQQQLALVQQMRLQQQRQLAQQQASYMQVAQVCKPSTPRTSKQMWCAVVACVYPLRY